MQARGQIAGQTAILVERHLAVTTNNRRFHAVTGQPVDLRVGLSNLDHKSLMRQHRAVAESGTNAVADVASALYPC